MENQRKDIDNPEQQKLDAQKGLRLKNLVNQAGWTDFLELFKKEWNAAYYILRNGKTEKEKTEANITLDVIEKLLKKVNKGIGFGEKQGDRMRLKALGKLSNDRPLL